MFASVFSCSGSRLLFVCQNGYWECSLGRFLAWWYPSSVVKCKRTQSQSRLTILAQCFTSQGRGKPSTGNVGPGPIVRNARNPNLAAECRILITLTLRALAMFSLASVRRLGLCVSRVWASPLSRAWASKVPDIEQQKRAMTASGPRVWASEVPDITGILKKLGGHAPEIHTYIHKCIHKYR